MSWSGSGALIAVLLLMACTSPPPTPTETSPEVSQPALSTPPPATPAPSPTAPAPETTPATAPTAPIAEPLDTTGWTTFVSEQHGFAIGRPPDWSVIRAVRSWTIEVDAGVWENPALDAFLSADKNFWVVAWTARYEDAESLAGVHRWVDDYCRRSTQPCGEDPGLRVPLCNGRGSCHPGLLLPDEFPQAFFTGGMHGRRMTVVAAGRPPDWQIPGHGNALQVFEAFLSTMDVCRVGDADPRGCASGTPLAGATEGAPLSTERP